MNILYCGDDKTEDGLLISILSLLDAVEEELHIYILTMERAPRVPVSDRAAEFLDRKVKEAGEENFVKKIDVTELFDRQPPTANMETRFTPYCMLRLYADQVPELPERILYLDNDVVCRTVGGSRKKVGQPDSLLDFYYQDMEDWELAGVPDYYGKWFFSSRPFRRDYFNSGVLLLNMKKIRQTGLFEQCRVRCAEKKMFMPDQSALNKLSERKKRMPRRFNEQRKLHSDTVLQHFTTSFRFIPWPHTLTVKPWNTELVHEKLKLHEYDDLLAAYQSLLPQMKGEIAA